MAQAIAKYEICRKLEQVIENDPRVEDLREVCSVDDGETGGWTPMYNETGKVQIQKGALKKVPAPLDFQKRLSPVIPE